MRTLKLTIAYDGTDYVGWQVQKNGIAIQQRLEEAWHRVTQESIRITASGRTDKGVHAEAQVCGLVTQTSLSHRDLFRALNAETPFDMAVLKVEDAPQGFHAIRDAIEKTYCYQIQYGRLMDPMSRRYYWHVPYDLDVDAMAEGAAYLKGQHDFISFQSAGAERLTTVRTVSQLDVEPVDDGGEGYFPRLNITITSDGFLYKMVRNIVGTLVRVGQGTRSPDWVGEVRDQKDRRAAGETAPGHGLFLKRVVYAPRPVPNAGGGQDD